LESGDRSLTLIISNVAIRISNLPLCIADKGQVINDETHLFRFQQKAKDSLQVTVVASIVTELSVALPGAAIHGMMEVGPAISTVLGRREVGIFGGLVQV
jgi:hypothetical protein